MRIIAGRFRRRPLKTNPGLVTRPITDRVKESLFERLGEAVVGRRVADVFAGTGTLGLEALSRGADSVVFVEQDPKAHELLRENVARLGVESETLCWRADVLRCSFRPRNVEAMVPFDLVFFDPPYRMVPDLRPGHPLFKAVERLARPGVTADGALMIFRTPADSEFELPAAWGREGLWQIGGMDLHRLRIPPRADAAEPDVTGD